MTLAKQIEILRSDDQFPFRYLDCDVPMLRSALSHLQDHEVLELLPLNLLYTFDVVLVHDEALEFRKIAEALHLRPRGELAAGDVEEAEAREAGGLEGGGRGGGRMSEKSLEAT